MAKILAQLIGLLTLLCLLSPASAGYVRNNTPWTMKITYDPNSSSASHWCQFWNWNLIGGSRRVRCTHRDLPPNSGSSGDVDGFTFHDREFTVNGRRMTRGVWTKITDINAVYCDDRSGRAWCVW